MNAFRGTVAVVTGASGGIGEAISIATGPSGSAAPPGGPERRRGSR